jgi:ferredoxin
MSDVLHLSRENLHLLVEDLLKAGTEVVAPVRASETRVEYQPLRKSDEMVVGGDLPRFSLKGQFLPPTEPLLRWKQGQKEVETEPAPTVFPPRVVLGARPCDAAAVQILDKVMDWDYHDDLWFGRREATTVISFACPGYDSSCFCTAVGSGPDDTRGSDILLVPAGDGFEARIVTEKGKAFASAHIARFSPSSAEKEAEAFVAEARKKVSQQTAVHVERVSAWLDGHFEDQFWNGLALRCHGCGACASVCPTCHCFDIVDEPEGTHEGCRRRNWDTCQTSKFTLHGSGHNPRCDQNARIRQRVLHKFSIYPKRFDTILCTGCGRCARACPGGMDLPEVLTALDALAAHVNQ